MLRNVSTIQSNWLTTVEGDAFMKQLFGPSMKRKIFGVLEKPDISINVTYEEVSYKLFFVGKSSANKSRLIAELAGELITHQDSHGIHKSNLCWPTKIWDKIILFQLLCWEAGDSGLKKFSHILPACLEKSDALVFVFSFEDKNSLMEISQNIVKLKTKESNQPAIIVIGTRYSTDKNVGISFADVREFESKWHLNVLRISPTNTDMNDVMRVAPVLNSICELLWLRDQEYILKQSFDKFALKE